jgi:hypothetical protein
MTSDPAVAGSPSANVAPPAKRGPLRRLYDWGLSWADSPHALTALAAFSFA